MRSAGRAPGMRGGLRTAVMGGGEVQFGKKSSVRAGCRIRNRRRREGKLSGNVIIPFVSPVDTALDDFGRIAGNYDVRFIKFCGNAAVPTDN